MFDKNAKTSPQEGGEDDTHSMGSEMPEQVSRFRYMGNMRDFIVYVIFAIVFSLVAFYSKPGEIQQLLTSSHTDTFSVGLDSVATYEDIYNWLIQFYAPLLYPEVNPPPQGSPTDTPVVYLGMPDRLYVSGNARILAAHRIRQVRSNKVDCDVMDFMSTVDGYEIECLGEYSEEASVQDIYDEDSSQYAALGDFRLPFTYRDIKDLDTRSIELEGIYASYHQDGFAMDALPNISPRMLAEELRACQAFFQESIDECAARNGFNAETPIVVEACPSNPDTFPIRPLAYDNALDIEHCVRLPTQPLECQLDYVPLALAAKYMSSDACSRCTCAPDDDPFCNQNCSPRALFADQVARLRVNRWLSEDTRAVIVDTALFNQEANLFSLVRHLFEFPPYLAGNTGNVRMEVDTVKLFRYVTKADTAVLGLEIVLMVMLLYYTATELIELRRLGKRYFRDPWNYIDWANYAILYAVVILRFLSWSVIEDSDFRALQETYVDFPSLVDWANKELKLMAFNFFLIYFKFFKYLSNVPRMDAILVTISACLFDLTLFMIMAVIILLGFLAAFFIVFGPYLAEFSTAGKTLSQLMRILLGDFDYDAMRKVDPVMAPLLFYLYISFVFFILLNMFLAIVNDSYAEVKANQTEEDLHFYINLKDKLVDKMSILLGRKKAINKLAKDLLRDVEDDVVTLDELRDILQDNPQALAVLETTTIEELMAKYDINNDGSLSRAEVRAILKELAEKEAAVQAGIRDEEERADGGRQGAGRIRTVTSGVKDVGALEDKVDEIGEAVSELSRNVAKKMALMIELMMSLSDQVGQ